MRLHALATVIALGLALFASIAVPAGAGEAEIRSQAEKAYRKSNWKDAFDLYRKLLEDPTTDPRKVGNDLYQSVSCLDNLTRQKERDAVIEAAVKLHAGNWRLLQWAVQAYENGPHFGHLVAGQFERGHHRGSGQWIQTEERDRVRVLQIIQQTLPLVAQPPERDRGDAASFWLFAADRLSRRGQQAWRLQYLTDLTKLPEWDEPSDHSAKGAPVDAGGNPVFHRLPESWEKAASDGERWRWLLAQAAAAGKSHAAQYRLTTFLREQFDVHTLQQFGWRQPEAEAKDADSGDPTANPWAVESLTDDETIARLATGPKRFTLPEEFRYIAQLKAMGGEEACRDLAQIYENRRRFVEAAAWWLRAKNGYNGLQRARQITGNWGTFETTGTQPAGLTAKLDFRYRNATAVRFTARPVDVEALLADVKEYIEDKPKQIDWNKSDLNDIGRRLVYQNQEKYLGAVAKEWDLKLTPKPGHADRRISVEVPQLPAGGWLVESQVAGGNASRVVVWLADLVLVKKQAGDGKALFWTVDALSGEPVAGATITGFGYQTSWKKPLIGKEHYLAIDTTDYQGTTDADGLLLTKPLGHNHQWFFTAQQGQRRAFLGWTGIWHMNRSDQERYDQTKTLVISDRPAYRPGQVVKVKAWTARTRYDLDEKNEFAGQSQTLYLINPKGEKIADQRLTCDAFGGIQGEFTLPPDAALGAWVVGIHPYRHHRDGSLAIRVEEYKKPEFEVTVDPPSEPVVLGGTLTAAVKATYYFGAPVAKGTVKYKVLRHEHDQRWFPAMPWDWLYGSGYWWFDGERPWYPGWRVWGCKSPRWSWWHTPQPPPELIADGEGKLAPDGTFSITIDSGPAKLLHGDADHRYEITAEITDDSRRTIVGSGSVIAARKPFAVTVWADRGWIQTGSVADVHAAARTPDGKPVAGDAVLRLMKIAYAADGTPTETEVTTQKTALDADGRVQGRFVFATAGQYRCVVTVTTPAKAGKTQKIEGASLITAIGAGSATAAGNGRDYRFNDVELTVDKREYAPGDTAQVLVGVGRAGAAVLLFDRPVHGVYGPPKVLRLNDRQTLEPVAISLADMPNVFLEAVTVHSGRAATVVRELIVPPQKRTLNVSVTSDATRYLPGAKAALSVKVTDLEGKPVAGALALTMYDQALEYISGGPNVPEIRSFFWKWRRSHQPQTEHSLTRSSHPLLRQNEAGMNVIGCFGLLGADGDDGQVLSRNGPKGFRAAHGRSRSEMPMKPMASAAPAPGEIMSKVVDCVVASDKPSMNERGQSGADPDVAPLAPATVRSNFADAAFWSGALLADANGVATVTVPMPENLTGWKVRTWAMAQGTRVGEASTTLTTAKDLLVRLQAPRFFQERDEVVLSANVHNYLKDPADCTVAIELPGPSLKLHGAAERRVTVAAGGETRVDWRVQVVQEGEALVRISARSAKESDAMEQKFPVKVHGAPIQVAWSRVIRPGQDNVVIPFTVPAERRPDQTRLEVRWSPTLAGALVDALPYLASYPYGCTEQTLNRFLPTVICQRVLKDLKIDLPAIKAKRANLNAQEIGDPKQRAEGWKRGRERRSDAPIAVWDDAEVAAMVRAGVTKLQNMQMNDGGWGWFSGWGEHSSPHLTSLVVRGLLRAKTCGAAIDKATLDRGLSWLQRHQDEQAKLIRLWERTDHKEGKPHPDSQDALVDLALAESGQAGSDMAALLWRDAAQLPPYGKALFALGCHLRKQGDKVAELRKNLEQFLKQDDENQSAWLDLGPNGWWWCWYGDEIETQAAYLKLLAAVDPKAETGARLVKYLLNNRKHATRWNSTRDTSLVIDALADWLKASGEDQPDCRVSVLVDGKVLKEVKITADTLFDGDNTLVLEGAALATGKHRLELIRVGKGPLYSNAYLNYFSLEEGITKQGLEIKVERAMYRLVPKNRTIKAQGAGGQALDQKVEAWDRQLLADGAKLTSGDLVEIELTIDSKNDYEYLLFLDPKVAGFEPYNVRSGYLDKGLHAFAEWRDDRSCLFVDRLPRGRSSVAWRMRAEIPGIFHALPTRAEAMYAPELKANADELRISIDDRKD